MHRRDYLRATAVGLAGGVAGCGGGAGQPETYLDVSDPRDADVYPYPVHGEQLPAATLEAPLRDEDVAVRDIDRDVVMTFFYSYCQTVCPRLVSVLRNVQTAAAEDGHTDDVALVAVTFDPERDTAERLAEYAEAANVDMDLGNWYFLRPESPERAQEVVAERYGVAFERTHPEDMDRYMFNHFALTLLANRQGFVERPYAMSEPQWQTVYDHLTTLRDQEG